MNKKKNQQALDVVVAGLAVVDLIAKPVEFGHLPRRGGLRIIDSVTMTTGGNVCNFCIDLAKLGFSAGAITRVGEDGLGNFIRSQLQEYRVNIEGIIVDKTRQTSTTVVAVGRDGERSFLHTRGCLKNFRAGDVLDNLPLVRRGKIFAFGYYGLLPECEKDLRRLFRTIKEETATKILVDTGGTPSSERTLLKQFLPFVDYFIPSYEEAVACTGRRSPASIVRYLFSAGAPGVVGVKLGSRGCYIASGNNAAFIPAFKVRNVVDSTGAGDAFVSGFLGATLRGFDPFAAARFGNAVAAESVTAVGASTAVHPLGHYASRIMKQRVTK